ncbi:MAG: sigma-70 family RNA polymerase sigma factor [Firmicutes bacterium]|nr:sigma-70 family RNA polymerase sigma factor [Bacillota bacterium]
MNCTNCGKKITKGDAYCPHCGKAVGAAKTAVQSGTGSSMAGLVELARTGDQNAVSALYEQTYSQTYYTVKSMIKDEDAVFDILQDSYIKAFSHLDQFSGDQFTAWIRRIASNTAKDWLRKQRPMLFSELEMSDDSDIPAEERFEDDRTENLPDQVIDQAETKRLIREIIEELPEDQRAAIGMFYYEEMSVRDIAKAMGATENAVKSRLMYGRKKIEKKVLELESKGTKLHGLAPIPFLRVLFKNLLTRCSEMPDPGILAGALEALTGAAGAGAAAAVGSAVGTAAGAAAAGGFSAVKITIIAVVAALAVGGGAFGINKLREAAAERRASASVPEYSAVSVVESSELPEYSEAFEISEVFEESEIPEESEESEESVLIEESEVLEESEQSEESTLPVDGDRIVLSGTINTYSYEEVLELQGQPDPNGVNNSKGWIYRIIILDTPQPLQGRQDINTVERMVSMIIVYEKAPSGLEFIFTPNIPTELDGQHIVFSIGDVSWSSGTDIPMGAARIKDIRILE